MPKKSSPVPRKQAFIDITPHLTASPTHLASNWEIQYARLLGMCVAAWAHAEEALTLVLGTLLGVDHRRAEIVFYASRSEQFRVDLIWQLARELPPKALETLNKRLTQFTTLAGKRNAYIHSLWKVDQNNNHTIIPSKAGPIDWFVPRDPVTTKDLRDFFNEIETLEQGIISDLNALRSLLALKSTNESRRSRRR